MFLKYAIQILKMQKKTPKKPKQVVMSCLYLYHSFPLVFTYTINKQSLSILK